MPRRQTVSVDFDGVIHSYIQPWQGAHVIPDPPVEGSIEWLWRTIQKFDVQILSTRAKTWRGRRAMRRWLRVHAGNLYYEDPAGGTGIEDVSLTFDGWPDQIKTVALGKGELMDLVDKRGLKNCKVTARKGPALVYIDDRAWRFDGKNFPSVDEVYKALPWWKKSK